MSYFYFATDGNYGDADDLVVVEADDLDPHFLEVVDNGITDSERQPYAKWFQDNDHEPEPTDYEHGISSGLCSVCDHWENGDLPED